MEIYIKYYKKKATFALVLIVFLSFQTGCKKFIEVDAPITSVNGGNVFTDDANAIGAVTGIYTKMASASFSLNLSLYPELSSDNLKVLNLANDVNTAKYFQNALTENYNANNDIQFWGPLYNYIYLTNAAIQGLTQASSLTPAVKQRLTGEVYFLRAFFYFYLVNLYGDVPLALSTDYEINNGLTRSSSDAVYLQIISDLLKAEQLLDDRYVDETLVGVTSERVRPNVMAVKALLARVYLYTKNYSAAENAASEVIKKTELYSAEIPLDQIYLKNSKETIWALQPVKSNFNTDEGAYFIPDANENVIQVALSDNLLSEFEASDKRKSNWVSTTKIGAIDYFYPSKYKVRADIPKTEYQILLRLAELYLIRSEARNEQNNTSGAREDLNLIRRRSGLGDTPASEVSEIRLAIFKERRLELFTEGGHRWLDLKRSGKVNEIMGNYSTIKGSTWQLYKALYPIPFSDIQINRNLKQNPFYSN
ncbi:RagB/SusD family nutrient uptake outer membrane protein [Pedobacter sp. JY14-1]|uniref:RagB/SusD family nutrient uptake outer membrane protein n=1 Tax=Pedobacter sp. JY14-1 TaxID=3034151 RepID=UPI0023E2C086|nr:RagB/SusD family nutrient uptake outer membrane protein [Pedobacter sp. JY14-1]